MEGGGGEEGEMDQPPDGSMQSPMSQELMDKALELGVKGLFETATMATFGANKTLSDLVAKNMNSLMTSMDSLGKILVAHRYNAENLSEQVGEDRFEETTNTVADVFSKLGDLILKIMKSDNRSQAINSSSVGDSTGSRFA
jgi:hypothetical protein